MTTSREIRLRSKPSGAPTLDNFELVSTEVPPPGPGEVQVRNQWMSLDPWQIRAIREAVGSEAGPQPSKYGSAVIGKVPNAGAVGEVVASNDPGFKPGDLVVTLEGWREVFNAPAKEVEKLEPKGLPPQAYLGPAGIPGLCAYAGITKNLQIKAGDVLFVSGAAGAVGSLACQIAKIYGATVIGSAGGAEKVAFLKSIGVDHAIDYKATPDLNAALAQAAPGGIDAFLDNVGGKHLAAAINSAKPFCRILLVGLIGTMGTGAVEAVPTDLMKVVRNRIRIEGFSSADHFADLPKWRAQLAEWVAQGKIVLRETVDEGVASAPGALLKLLSGGNTGKMLVKLS
jgi:hypothetical protein